MTDPPAALPNRATRSARVALRSAALGRSGPLARLAVALVLASALAPAWLVAEVRPAQAAEPIGESTDSTFQLVPGSNKVHVTVKVTIHNNKRDSATIFYYVSNTAVVVDAEGTNFRAVTTGGSAFVKVKRTAGDYYANATLTFPRVLSGQSRTITLSYDLLGGSPRSNSYARASPAYARFCGFLAGEYLGDVNSMRILVPLAFTVNQYAGDVVGRTDQGDNQVLVVPATTLTSSSNGAVTCVEAVNEAAYVGSSFLSTSGVQLTVKAWPNDNEWRQRISVVAGPALDKLEAAIGEPPPTTTVAIDEVVSEALGGYAGDSDIFTGIVRISETAMEQQGLAAHELAHLWFSFKFSTENWLIEGYAEYFARRLTPDDPACTEPPASVLAGIDLARWAFLPPEPTDADQATVQHMYDTACWIITDVASKMTDAQIKQVYADIAHSQIPYVGAGTPEATAPGPVDWRRWLDTVDERVLGYDQADPDWLQNLLASVGVTHDAGELTARSKARQAYHQLLSDEAPWAAPYAVRELMTSWLFDSADAAIAVASEAAAAHTAAVALVPGLGAATKVRTAYEAAADSAALGKARDLAKAELKAAGVVGAAVSGAGAGHGPLDAIGLLGQDLGSESSAAVAALVAGDYPKATREGKQVNSELAGAPAAGGLRLGGAAVVLLGGGGAFVLLRRRRRPSRVAVATPDAEPSRDEGDGEPPDGQPTDGA